MAEMLSKQVTYLLDKTILTVSLIQLASVRLYVGKYNSLTTHYMEAEEQTAYNFATRRSIAFLKSQHPHAAIYCVFQHNEIEMTIPRSVDRTSPRIIYCSKGAFWTTENTTRRVVDFIED